MMDDNRLGYAVAGKADSLCGRFLVATRDFEAGETILIDRPFIAAPSAKSPPVCLHCFTLNMDENEKEKNRCPNCHLPLCENEICQGKNSFHTSEECQIFRQAFDRMSPDKREKIMDSTRVCLPCPLYASIGPLRLLLAKEKFPKDYSDNFSELLDHAEERKEQDRKGWLANQILVCGFLKGACRLNYKDEEIHKAIGMLRTNGVKLDARSGSSVALGLYPKYSLLNHNCVTNTRTTKYPLDGHSLEVKATRPILAGEEINTRYVTPQLSTLRRQSLLQSQWYFSCQCKRCRDPTEFHSYLNAIKCRSSDVCEGLMLPENPTDLESSWNCQKCNFEQDSKFCLGMITELEGACEKLAKSEEAEKFAENCKNWQAEAVQKLAETHSLNVKLKEIEITRLMRTQKALTSSAENDISKKQGLLICLEKQVKLFSWIRDIMIKVDPPGDIWDEALSKKQTLLSSLNQ